MSTRILAALALAGLPLIADAHAFLDHASPRVGSSVGSAPAEVTLWFSQEVEPAFSTVRVTDKDGKEVDRQDKRIDPSDRSVMRVSLQPLGAGTYKVQWRVLSVDTHVTEGDFTFTVKP